MKPTSMKYDLGEGVEAAICFDLEGSEEVKVVYNVLPGSLFCGALKGGSIFPNTTVAVAFLTQLSEKMQTAEEAFDGVLKVLRDDLLRQVGGLEDV